MTRRPGCSRSRRSWRCSRSSMRAGAGDPARGRERGDYREAFAAIAAMQPGGRQVLRRRAGDGRRCDAAGRAAALVARLRDSISSSCDIVGVCRPVEVSLRRLTMAKSDELAEVRTPDRSDGRPRRPSRKKARKREARSRQAEPSAKAQGKYVYLFGKKTDGNGSMKPLLGGKGANLAEMCRIGLPVPPGFTITTEVCTYYYEHKRTYPSALRAADGGRHRRHRAADRQEVRRPEEPAARVVRSGARDSMPGMMDTILNLGLNDQTVEALAPQDRQPALRVGLLPPLRPDVRRRRARRAEAARRGSRAVRDGDRGAQARALSPGHRGHEAHGRRPEGARRPLQGARQGACRQAISRPRRGIS